MTGFTEINARLMADGVALLPTETVYGLACLAENSAAVEKIYAMKGRDFHKTLAVCVKDLEQAQKFGVFTPKALGLAKTHWPGSLTIIVEAKEDLLISENCFGETGDKLTIAFRCPDAVWRNHLKGPLALTSANRSGDKDCVSYDVAMETFGDNIDASLATDGPLSGQPSTIVSTVDDIVKVFRHGALDIESGDSDK